MTADEITRIDVGGDAPEGTNSAYLVGDRAVVDPGPPTDRAWRDLRAGLERTGVEPAALEYVLVTHWHADHAGLAPRLAAAADAALAMGAGDAPLVADYAEARERRLERDAATMDAWGVPADAVGEVIDGDAVSAMPDETPVERLADGDRVAGLEAIATPGHTLGHTAFAGDGFVLVGDAVLPTTTPNVGGSDTRTLRPTAVNPVRCDDPAAGSAAIDHDPLAAFRRTLERLADRSERLLPGHGTAVESGRVAEILTHHRERSRRVFAALERRGTATPWDLAGDLFGDLAGIHVKFGAGEAAAHLRTLERQGRVDRLEGTPRRYRPVDGEPSTRETGV
ncbi:MBL fold metallo-hydrolase [Natrinema thermotolerans]|uniref:MBL fold metallo-hydrolase n=1 Tax=Natrinema thermotolerans TaxID=121872 RepID=A0AAF0PD74_9EURY|nr:MBL fold metallo-hydrolase [Natrinema thermotolerans]QCC60695.1 MBL fold metallo-hydrolase [Natrinema thermotolerans]WMT07737.1 MBL fold metallo-hydrolase [Natrinema thermotolerans]WMT08369.1 MBL fold metallo-hydrolase [Natrinema thermotolerans]